MDEIASVTWRPRNDRGLVNDADLALDRDDLIKPQGRGIMIRLMPGDLEYELKDSC